MADDQTRNDAFDRWFVKADSKIADADGKPIPLGTELLYSICDNNTQKFIRVVDMLQAAFEAGQKQGRSDD